MWMIPGIRVSFWLNSFNQTGWAKFSKKKRLDPRTTTILVVFFGFMLPNNKVKWMLLYICVTSSRYVPNADIVKYKQHHWWFDGYECNWRSSHWNYVCDGDLQLYRFNFEAFEHSKAGWAKYWNGVHFTHCWIRYWSMHSDQRLSGETKIFTRRRSWKDVSGRSTVC